MASSAAAGLLGRQLKAMAGAQDIPGISCGLVDNTIFEWEVMLMIDDECRHYGGTSVEVTLIYVEAWADYSATSRQHEGSRS